MSRPDNRPPFDDSVNPRTLSQRSVSAVADYIRSGHVSKIVFMVRLRASALFLPSWLSLIEGNLKARGVIPI